MKAQPDEEGGYDTMIEAITALKEKGYTYDFNMLSNGLEGKVEGDTMVLSPQQFDISEVHRFEGMSNPSDNSILYAITSEGGLKGTLVSAYGVYADAMSSEMIEKLDTRHIKH